MLYDNIKALMKSRHINMMRLAEGSGVPYATLYSIAKQGDNCRLSTLVALADYFGVSLDFLVRGQDSSNEHESALLAAYRAQPDIQKAVDRLVGIAPAEVTQAQTDEQKESDEELRQIITAFTQVWNSRK